MALKPKSTDSTPSEAVSSTQISELIKQQTNAWDSLSVIRSSWADKERLLIARLSDSYSQKSTRSHVTDGHLSSLVFERQSRVASQLPTGNVYSLDSKDDGTAKLMQLVLQKYIVPNANSQFDLLTKFRMSGVYASVYGAQPILYDYRIDDEYVGPDCWLVPVRNFLPQPGKNSVRDCDWVMVSTEVSASYLDAILARKQTKWNKKNIRKLLDLMKSGAVPSRDLNSDKKSAVENVRSNGRPYGEKGQAGRVTLITKYEKGTKGHWVTFAPDYEEVDALRDIPNPHKNGRIPIVMRQCFPLMDSIFGLGDFERGITLQKAKDSLINLYMDAVKLSIFPPLKVDLSGVTASTIKYEAGSRWLVSDMNAIQQFENNPQGMSTFQGTYQFLTSALLNQNGTTDTQVDAKDSGNPAFGKTPAAIEALQSRENARDNWDRFQLEKMVEDLYGGWVNLIGELQEKPINIHVFDEDAEEIEEEFADKDGYKNSIQRVNSRVVKLSLTKKILGGKCKFVIDDSSSMSTNQQAQHEALQGIAMMYLQAQPVIDQLLAKDNMTFSFAENFKQLIINSGVSDWDDLLKEMPEEQQQAMVAAQQLPGMPGQPPMPGGQPLPPQGGMPMPGGQPPIAPPQGAPLPPQGGMPPKFNDPQIAQLAQQLFGNHPSANQPQPPMNLQPPQAPQMPGGQ